MSRRHVLKDIARTAGETVQGSIFSRHELFGLVEKKFRGYEKRDELVDGYQKGTIDRRQFLKILGLGTFAGAAAAGGVDYIFGEDIGMITGMASGNTFNVASDGGASAGSDITSIINSNQGKTIVVPGDEYRIEGTASISGGTTLLFDGSTLRTGNANYLMFDCEGSGWHVGGDVEIDQSGAYPRLWTTGSGQFGDENGRISFVNSFGSEDVIGVKRQSPTGWWRASGSDGDELKLQNVDQHEGPHKNACSDVNFIWTTYQGTMKTIGCHLGNFHDNGYYLKAMRGRAEFYDTCFDGMNVAACRNGCDKGVLMKNCLVVNNGNRNPQRTAGAHCEGVNHSMMAFQDKNGSIGDVMLDNVHYYKVDDPNAGEFLRNMSHLSGQWNGPVNVTIKDCQWANYPTYGSGSSVANITEEGQNGSDPIDNCKACPFEDA